MNASICWCITTGPSPPGASTLFWYLFYINFGASSRMNLHCGITAVASPVPHNPCVSPQIHQLVPTDDSPTIIIYDTHISHQFPKKANYVSFCIFVFVHVFVICNDKTLFVCMYSKADRVPNLYILEKFLVERLCLRICLCGCLFRCTWRFKCIEALSSLRRCMRFCWWWQNHLIVPVFIGPRYTWGPIYGPK